MPTDRPFYALSPRNVANLTPKPPPPASTFSCIRSFSDGRYLRVVRFSGRHFQEAPLPFRVRCPRCGQTAEISEAHLGRQGQCNNCGSLVAIPTRLSKVCYVCGVDLTDIPHTKDEHSNYLCNDCYHTRQAASPTPSHSARLECSICHVRFPAEQADAPSNDPICPDCTTILEAHQSLATIPIAQERPLRSVPTALAEAPPRLEELELLKPIPRPPVPQIFTTPTAQFTRSPATSSTRLPLILSSIALVGVLILATIHFAARREPAIQNLQPSQPDNVDQQTLTRVLILKAQAEVLIDVGKLREGIEKYDALLRIAPSAPAIAAELDSAKLEREKAVKLLAASATSTLAQEKPIPEARKNGTIFDEK